MQSVTVRAPAKVNLQLVVGSPRTDGYHDLLSVFHAVSLFDEVTVSPAARFAITVEGDAADLVPSDRSNIAASAARAIAAEAKPRKSTGGPPNVRIHIRKGIPVAGGMAGGSADAAATLLACDALWGTNLWQSREGRQRMLELAAGVGADVPFALLGGTAVGHGKGDQLTPALARGTYHWVFALSEDGLATPAVYAEWDRLRAGGGRSAALSASAELMAALSAGDPVALGATLSNDLQDAALRLRPQLQRTLDAGREHGALGAIVSGSGPTCAFLAKDTEHRYEIAVALSAMGVCRTVRTATGPVSGARVVEPSV